MSSRPARTFAQSLRKKSSAANSGGVRLGGLVVYVVAVESLAVAADRKPPCELIDLGSRRTHAVAALELRLFGHCHVGARPLELLRQHLYRALKLSDAVFIEEIRIRGRSGFVRQRWRGQPDQRQCHQATCEFRHRDQPLQRAAYRDRTSSSLSDRDHLDRLHLSPACWWEQGDDQSPLAAPALELDGALDHAGQQAPAEAATIHLSALGRTAGANGCTLMKLKAVFINGPPRSLSPPAGVSTLGWEHARASEKPLAIGGCWRFLPSLFRVERGWPPR